MHLLVDLACTQDDVEEQYADTDSEERIIDSPLQDPSSLEENDDLDCATNFSLIRQMCTSLRKNIMG
jgi:hypothetical protein